MIFISSNIYILGIILFNYTNNLVIGNIDLKLRKDQVRLSKVYINKLTQILLNDLRRIRI